MHGTIEPKPIHKDAIEFQSDASEIALRPVPWTAKAFLYSIVGFVAAAILWASVGQVDRVITASGRITTEAPQIVIQPFETSVIRSLNVKAGDTVHKGDILAALDPTFVDADSGTVTVHLASLQAQALRLKTELAGKNIDHFSTNADIDALNRQIDDTRRIYVSTSIATFDAQLHELDEQAANTAHETDDVHKQVDAEKRIEGARQELYDRKVGSLLQLLESSNSRIGIEREAHKLQNTLAGLKAQGATLRQKRAAFIAEWRNKAAEELQTTQQDIDKAGQDLRKSTRRTDLVQLTAPDDAVVLQMAPRSVGSVAREGETLMTLVPLHSPLQITADLDPADVARVRAGDKVTVKLDALPFQRHGTIEGVLKVVSEDTVERGTAHTPDGANAQSGQSGQSGQNAVYRAVIEIKDQQLRDVPDDFHLMPGMNVKAEIKIGQRRLISYVLYPLLQAGSESFREP